MTIRYVPIKNKSLLLYDFLGSQKEHLREDGLRAPEKCQVFHSRALWDYVFDHAQGLTVNARRCIAASEVRLPAKRIFLELLFPAPDQPEFMGVLCEEGKNECVYITRYGYTPATGRIHQSPPLEINGIETRNTWGEADETRAAVYIMVVVAILQLITAPNAPIATERTTRKYRKYIRRIFGDGTTPSVEYKVLVFCVPGKTHGAVGTPLSTGGASRRLHHVRAHPMWCPKAMRYVWRRNHWRGDQDSGVIVKDYRPVPQPIHQHIKSKKGKDDGNEER